MPFFLANWRYLTFGWLFTALSTLGSGYFVGLFNTGIREEFGLSHADIGFIFTVTTLVGGPVLMWLGRKIDDIDLRLYSVALCAGLAAGSFLMATSLSVVVTKFRRRICGDGPFNEHRDVEHASPNHRWPRLAPCRGPRTGATGRWRRRRRWTGRATRSS